MEKSNKITKIDSIIDSIFRNIDYIEDFKLLKIKKKWPDIIGDKLFKHASPYKLYNDVLIIKCDHQGWINTLQLYKKNILDNIKLKIDSNIIVNDIKFIYKSKV